MIACTKCQTANSIDSTFCKSCGEALPADVREAAQVEHDQLVAEGYKALNEGRTEEALLIAQNCLENHPNSISALSLKGMVLEREGKLAEALEVFERVVSLNPDSALDKIKVQQLRNSLSAQVLRTPEPNRKSALVMASAATIFVIALGVAIASINRGDATQKNDLNPNLTAENTGRNLPTGVPDIGQNPNRQATDGNAASPNPAGANANPATGDPNRVQPVREGNPDPGPSRLTYNGAGRLPSLGNGGSALTGDVAPIRIDPGNLGIQPTEGSTNPNRTGNRDDIDPDVTNPNGNQNSTTTQAPPAEEKDPGVYDIKIGNRPQNAVSGGTSATNSGGNGLTAVMTAANQQFQAGRFDQAARSYERALGMGGDAARVNQRLGQCYQKLGRNGDAIAAYRRAINTLDARLKSGSGNKDVVESQLESCRQALRALGG